MYRLAVIPMDKPITKKTERKTLATDKCGFLPIFADGCCSIAMDSAENGRLVASGAEGEEGRISASQKKT